MQSDLREYICNQINNDNVKTCGSKFSGTSRFDEPL